MLMVELTSIWWRPSRHRPSQTKALSNESWNQTLRVQFTHRGWFLRLKSLTFTRLWKRAPLPNQCVLIATYNSEKWIVVFFNWFEHVWTYLPKTIMRVVVSKLREYATPADLLQSGPILLRSWQINWEPHAGLRGYSDPDSTSVYLFLLSKDWARHSKQTCACVTMQHVATTWWGCDHVFNTVDLCQRAIW